MVNTEALTEPTLPPRWWYWFIVGGFATAILALIVGLFGLYVNDKNAAEDSRRAAAQARCFDQFAAQFSLVSKEVRAAQVQVDAVESVADEAAAKRDAAFQRVLTFVIAQSDDETEGLRLFTALTDANATLVRKRDALVKARKELVQTRKEHPIPDPPEAGSETCEL